MTEPTLRTMMVAMRDGVCLSTDIYLPPEALAGNPVPVLLERTPYDKRGTNHGDRTLLDPVPRAKPEIAAQFVSAGYAYVLQDCRGRFGSQGSFTKYLNEAEDGFDTIAWLMAQPWCNGKIGTLGLSYCAHVQAALATLDPPGLAAMFLDCGGFSSAYHNGVRQGGAFELKQLTWAYNQGTEAGDAQDPAVAQAVRAQDIREWIKVMPWRRGHSPLTAAPEYEDYVVEQWEHEDFSPFWQQRGIYWRGYYPQTANVPMVHLSGWYDPYSITAIENWTALSTPDRAPCRLILGPWTHGQRSVSFAGDVDFGPAAPLDANLAEDFVALRRNWFDHHLKGEGADALPYPVSIFVMGGGSGQRNADGRLDHGGQWRHESQWPPAAMVPQTWHFHADGALTPQASQVPDASLPYDADPANPVPTIGGAVTSGAPVMAAGAYDQRETEVLFGATQPGRDLGERPDVLSFVSAPLEEDMELTGQITARLFISSDAPDMDVTIKLIDLYPSNDEHPQGFAMNLAHGILRARYRNSFANPEPLEAGHIHEIEITAFPTSNLFLRGHRIRIDIAGSNFPHFDINQNRDWRVSNAPPQVAHNRLHLCASHPSSVILPVVPRRG
ncbi:CocE/NonD family hydrolase [Novosphingobium terrae]|uniref:CocE/NonD family hydrolase n=1 Tax=Novosphingobium terrae TaxID=2726189 RepID=UPI001981A60A|nr:CocE/NonD family hydrolase [Novosphingobium terrae]